MFTAILRSIFSGICFVFLLAAQAHPAENSPLRIYIDADFSVSRSAAEAIEAGVAAALAQVDFQINGIPLEIVAHNHRGSPRRSRANMATFLSDDQAIAIFGGMESPPYLTYGDFVNLSGIPLMLPWSAAGPITRKAQGSANFIFRLSVDDTKAGPYLVRTAYSAGCSKLAFLLIDTGWGRANSATMKAANEKLGQTPALQLMLDPDLGEVSARSAAREVKANGADCVLLVSTPGAGAAVLNAFGSTYPEVRVFSHWGILGDDITKNVAHRTREQTRLQVLQTCGLDKEKAGSAALQEALKFARSRGHKASALSDWQAPAGFVHGFDLASLVIQGLRQANLDPRWSGNVIAKRTALRDALEQLEVDHVGILRRYRAPFSPVSSTNPDGHEALGQRDLCLARFTEGGFLVASGE